MKSAIVVLIIGLFGVGTILSGCMISYSISKSSESISASLGKSSDSIVSISRSSSPSGNSAQLKEIYQDNVSNFTAAAVVTGQSLEDYLREVGRIAASHGITDWERERITYIAIGKGLRRAGVKEVEFGGLEFLEALLVRKQITLEYILEGYNS